MCTQKGEMRNYKTPAASGPPGELEVDLGMQVTEVGEAGAGL